jgi:hypothetical protein
VSLLNDARIAAGKAPLGFFNQVIYQNPQVQKHTPKPITPF